MFAPRQVAQLSSLMLRLAASCGLAECVPWHATAKASLQNHFAEQVRLGGSTAGWLAIISNMGGGCMKYDVVEISMISRGTLSQKKPYDFVQISYHAISRTAISRRGEMSQPRYLAPLRCRGRDIRGPGRGVGVSVPCFIRFDIKGASHFTLDGLNYFILFVCWGACNGAWA